MCIFMGKRFAVFLNSFLLLQSFWVKNAKIDFFKEKNGFEGSFYKKKMTFRSGLSDLKTPNY